MLISSFLGLTWALSVAIGFSGQARRVSRCNFHSNACCSLLNQWTLLRLVVYPADRFKHSYCSGSSYLSFGSIFGITGNAYSPRATRFTTGFAASLSTGLSGSFLS